MDAILFLVVIGIGVTLMGLGFGTLIVTDQFREVSKMEAFMFRNVVANREFEDELEAARMVMYAADAEADSHKSWSFTTLGIGLIIAGIGLVYFALFFL